MKHGVIKSHQPWSQIQFISSFSPGKKQMSGINDTKDVRVNAKVLLGTIEIKNKKNSFTFLKSILLKNLENLICHRLTQLVINKYLVISICNI